MRGIKEANMSKVFDAEQAKMIDVPDDAQEKKEYKNRRLDGCGIGACILIVVVILGTIWSLSNSSGVTGGYRTPTASDAEAMCMQFVRNNLKAPSTAKFDYGQSGAKGSGNYWTALVVVDAQNSFGAMIRSRFACTLEYTGNDNWKLTGLMGQ